ncbi:hypothetical protein QEN19_003389 [Hanseniaspora menglaensis]
MAPTPVDNNDLESQPLLLMNEGNNNSTNDNSISEQVTVVDLPPKNYKRKANRYFLKFVLMGVVAYLIIAFMVGYTLLLLQKEMKENQNSLSDLVVEKDNVMRLTIDKFVMPKFIPVGLVNLAFNYMLFPLFSLMRVQYFLPDCSNKPTILLELPMNVEFLKGENNSIIPHLTTTLNDHFIPFQLSHQICVATETYVLTPLDLMIEYVSRNKAEKPDDEHSNLILEDDKKKEYWEDQMQIGVQPYGLPFKSFSIREDLIKNSSFIQNLEILNKVDFNNTKFDVLNMKISGDFYIEIVLDMLKNVDLINFKMLKGDFIISLEGSKKEMLLVEIPQWQECQVNSKQADGLDMIVQLSLKEANVKVLNQSEFTKFGKRWFWDKKVNVDISSDIDLIISNDKWLGSMALRGLKSHDKAELLA